MNSVTLENLEAAERKLKEKIKRQEEKDRKRKQKKDSSTGIKKIKLDKESNKNVKISNKRTNQPFKNTSWNILKTHLISPTSKGAVEKNEVLPISPIKPNSPKTLMTRTNSYINSPFNDKYQAKNTGKKLLNFDINACSNLNKFYSMSDTSNFGIFFLDQNKEISCENGTDTFESTLCQSQIGLSEVNNKKKIKAKICKTNELNTTFDSRNAFHYHDRWTNSTAKNFSLSNFNNGYSESVSKNKRFECYEDLELFSLKKASAAPKTIDSFHNYKCNKIQKPFASKKHLRVLSLFDGIGAGILALKNNGFVIEKYYSSEIDENSVKILKKNHPEIIHLGDVTKLKAEHLSNLGINLVIGGSPCNDITGANPKKKGISNASGTGVLVFEFTRILNFLQPVCFKGRYKCSHPSGTCEICKATPFYWMFENVQSMTVNTKDVISRHLNCNPKKIDAEVISPATRKRFFWSNIPSMDTYTLKYRKGDPSCIKHCLIKERTFECMHKIHTITSKKDSIRIHEHESGHKHTEDCYLLCEEIELVMGMPPGYTKIAGLTPNDRRKLIAKSWSVQCATGLLSLLDNVFRTEKQNLVLFNI